MTQINLLSIYEFGKKHLGWIVAIILFLIMFNCNGDSDSKEIRKERDKQNVAYEKKIDSLTKANNSKDKLIAKSEKKVVEIEKKNDLLIGEIAKEKAKGQKQIDNQKKYDLKDWQKYYIEKTGYTKKEIALGNNTLNMTREPLIVIGNELVKADVVRAELYYTTKQLANTQKIVAEKDKIIEFGNGKIVNLQSIIESKDQINDNLVKNINDLNKDLKQAKRPKLKPIIIGVILGGVAGAIIAK